MRIRFYIALWVAKLYRFTIRLLGRNGSSTPGALAVRICPDFLSRITLPEKVICVTGTNGKTTTSNLLSSVLRDCGYTVTNNSLGSNIQGGVATAFLADSKLNGKPKTQIAVIEADERSALKIYKFFTPDFLICNNIMRDSLKRNAHTDFITYLLNTALSSETHVILNADDPICSHLFPNNHNRTYFGLDCNIPDESPDIAREIVYCPCCGAKLKWDYIRYEHIGRYSCPSCDFKAPVPDYAVTKIEDDYLIVKHGSDEIKLQTLNKNIVNMYNCCGTVAVLTELGISKEKIEEVMSGKQKIVTSRYEPLLSGKLNIIGQLTKGQNPSACARSFNFVASRPVNNKCVIVLADDEQDNTNDSESVCWIYDTDYSYLNNDSIDCVIFAGKRCRDHKCRAMMAGVPEEKILMSDELKEGFDLIDVNKYRNVFILDDLTNKAKIAKFKEELVKRGQMV